MPYRCTVLKSRLRNVLVPYIDPVKFFLSAARDCRVIHHDHYVDTFGLIPFQGFSDLLSFGRFQKLFKDQPLIQFNREVSVEDTDVQKSNQLLNSLDSHYLEPASDRLSPRMHP